MIFISSACSKETRIDKAVLELVNHGVACIELTGGTAYYPDYQSDLLSLKEQYNLTYLLHNYFPPPQRDFVINLASLDDEIFDNSSRQLKTSIGLSKALDANKFGFHAGFFLDLQVTCLGNTVGEHQVWDASACVQRFRRGLFELQKYWPQGTLYVENNVYSLANYQKLRVHSPFMLLTFADYRDLQQQFDFNMLLDIGHLYVTCNTLNLPFETELARFMEVSEYIHISSNDGISDQNHGLKVDSFLYRQLKQYDLTGKTISLEIYDGLDSVRRSYDLLAPLV